MPAKDVAKQCRMWGIKMVLLGILILANISWLAIRWDAFIGILLVIAGLVKMLMPCRK